jgi:hypothetical protein
VLGFLEASGDVLSINKPPPLLTAGQLHRLRLRMQMLIYLTLLLRNATMTMLALFPFLHLTFSLLCVWFAWSAGCGKRRSSCSPVATFATSGHTAHHTAHDLRKWLRHERIQRDPPDERMRDVHKLHHTQSVPMLDERSALHGNMPQRNDEEGGKQPRLSFSPAASVWGQMGRAWATLLSRMCHAAARAPFANVPCRCKRYFK